MIDGTVPADKVYEDDLLFVIKDIRPKARVHLLVIPKRHIENLNDVQEEHAQLLGYIMVSLKNFAKEQGLDSFRTITNTGPGSGQEIYHLHFHVLGGGTIAKF
jgi:histidine triad (HIT) family protein